jgi:hypothetical protein
MFSNAVTVLWSRLKPEGGKLKAPSEIHDLMIISNGLDSAGRIIIGLKCPDSIGSGIFAAGTNLVIFHEAGHWKKRLKGIQTVSAHIDWSKIDITHTDRIKVTLQVAKRDTKTGQ